jgi:hypothetical protein
MPLDHFPRAPDGGAPPRAGLAPEGRQHLTGNYYFSIRTRGEARLLREIVRDTDPAFLRWAVNEVVRWQPPAPVPGLVHLHGTADRIFPAGRIQSFIPIPGGGHFMVVQEAALLSRLVSEVLNRP